MIIHICTGMRRKDGTHGKRVGDLVRAVCSARVRPFGGMMYHHTEGPMPKTKLAVTLDANLVKDLDHLVVARRFVNRSQAIETAVAEKLARLAKTRLARECAKLEPQEEKALAEEGLAGGSDTWPEY